MRLVRKERWSFDARNGKDLEELVADWLTQHESTGWIPSALVLSALLVAIVLFAVSRLA